MKAVAKENPVSSQDGSSVHCVGCGQWIVLSGSELAEFNRGVGCVALLSLVIFVLVILIVYAFSMPGMS